MELPDLGTDLGVDMQDSDLGSGGHLCQIPVVKDWRRGILGPTWTEGSSRLGEQASWRVEMGAGSVEKKEELASVSFFIFLSLSPFRIVRGCTLVWWGKRKF